MSFWTLTLSNADGEHVRTVEVDADGVASALEQAEGELEETPGATHGVVTVHGEYVGSVPPRRTW